MFIAEVVVVPRFPNPSSQVKTGRIGQSHVDFIRYSINAGVVDVGHIYERFSGLFRFLRRLLLEDQQVCWRLSVFQLRLVEERVCALAEELWVAAHVCAHILRFKTSPHLNVVVGVMPRPVL